MQEHDSHNRELCTADRRPCRGRDAVCLDAIRKLAPAWTALERSLRMGSIGFQPVRTGETPMLPVISALTDH
jgi:hypothetical protein